MATLSSTCPLDCPDACGLLVETDDDGRFKRLAGDPDHPYTRGFLCGKTARYHELVHGGRRLLEPLVRRGGRLEPTSWEAAVALIAERVAAVRGEDILPLYYGANQGIVARRFPLRMMHALGAGAWSGGICSTTGEAGYKAVLGELIGPDVEDAAGADLLVLWGVDAARTWQHLLPIVKALCAGAVPVVVVDIYRTDTMRKVEGWGGSGLVLRPGSDAALALGLCRLLFERDQADRALLERDCVGAEAFEAHVRAGHDLASTCRATGLEAAQVEALAAALSRATRPFLKVGTGWTRRRHGGDSMRAVCSLAAVLGHPDRVLFESSDHFALAGERSERPELRGDRPKPPPTPQPALGRELCAGRYRVAFVWGHNPVVTVPDSARVRAGLSRDDLFLVVHEQVMSETAELADVVLPSDFFFEHTDLQRSYGHRWLQVVRKACEPPPGPRSNVRAFSAIARALALPAATWDVSEESVVEEVLEASRERLGDELLARLRAGERVKLPPRPRSGWGTPSGKVELASATAVAAGRPAMATYVAEDEGRELWLCPAPSVATHNSTYFGSPAHLHRAGAPRCWLHPELARAKGIGDGDAVRLESDHGRLTLSARLDDDVPPWLVRVDGLPRPADTAEGYGVNVLAGPELSDLGEGATFFSTRVDVTLG